MGRNDGGGKRMYIRELSNHIRQASKHVRTGVDFMREDQLVEMKEGLAKITMVILLRNRQRVLSQAWKYWITNADVHHDYTKDVRAILSRPTAPDEMRTELEIEVMHKWVKQNMEMDPTGLPHLLGLCKKKSAIVAALQHCRLETIRPGEGILYQGILPKAEDGHFTILSGICEVLQFSDTSLALLNLISCVKLRKWDVCNELLEKSELLTKLHEKTGFGELATLANIKRTASVRAAPTSETDIELLVLPRQQLLDCMQSRGSGDNAVISEAVDFFRHSGLANGISPSEIMVAAKNTIKRSLGQGEILFCKGEPVTSVYLVVSGELLLDTGDKTDAKHVFLDSNAAKCYYLSSKSILGDEGLVGQGKTYESTAVVMSDMCVVFEAVGSCLHFLSHQLNAVRYCALAYKDQSVLSYPISSAERTNIYSNFDSLRRCIANANKTRGTLAKSCRPEPPPSIEEIAKKANAQFADTLARHIAVSDARSTSRIEERGEKGEKKNKKNPQFDGLPPLGDNDKEDVAKGRRSTKTDKIKRKYSVVPISAIVGERRGSQSSARGSSRRGSSSQPFQQQQTNHHHQGDRRMSNTAFDALQSDAPDTVPLKFSQSPLETTDDMKLKIALDNAKMSPELRVRRVSFQKQNPAVSGAASSNEDGRKGQITTSVEQLRRATANNVLATDSVASSQSALRTRTASVVGTMSSASVLPPKRYISATALHRATEILKTAKHRAHEDGRKEARDNIVVDQLLTLKKADEKMGFRSEAEVQFEKTMQSHKLRMAAILIDEQEEEQQQWRLKDAHELHEFLVSVMAHNTANGGAPADDDSVSSDGDDGLKEDAAGEAGEEQEEEKKEEMTLGEKRHLEMNRSKIEMYLTGLRKSRQKEKARLWRYLEDLDQNQQRRGSVSYTSSSPPKTRSSSILSSGPGTMNIFMPKMPPAIASSSTVTVTVTNTATSTSAAAVAVGAMERQQQQRQSSPQRSNKIISLSDIQGGKIFDPQRFSSPVGQNTPWRPTSAAADNASSLGRTVEEEKRKNRSQTPTAGERPGSKASPDTGGRARSPGKAGGSEAVLAYARSPDSSIANALAAVQMNSLFASHVTSSPSSNPSHRLFSLVAPPGGNSTSNSNIADTGTGTGTRPSPSAAGRFPVQESSASGYVPFLGNGKPAQGGDGDMDDRAPRQSQRSSSPKIMMPGMLQQQQQHGRQPSFSGVGGNANANASGRSAVRKSIMRLGSMRGSMLTSSVRSSIMKVYTSKGTGEQAHRRNPSMRNKTSLLAHIIPNFSRSAIPQIRRTVHNKNPFPSLDPVIMHSDAAAQEIIAATSQSPTNNRNKKATAAGNEAETHLIPDLDDPRVFLEVLQNKDFSDRSKTRNRHNNNQDSHLWLTRCVKHSASASVDKDKDIVEKGSAWFQRLVRDLDIYVESSDSEEESERKKSSKRRNNKQEEVKKEEGIVVGGGRVVPEQRNISTAASTTGSSSGVPRSVSSVAVAGAPTEGGPNTARSGVSVVDTSSMEATATATNDVSSSMAMTAAVLENKSRAPSPGSSPGTRTTATSASGVRASTPSSPRHNHHQQTHIHSSSRRSSANDDATSLKSITSRNSRSSMASRRSNASLKYSSNSSQASHTRHRRDSEDSVYQETQEVIAQSMNAKRDSASRGVKWSDNSSSNHHTDLGAAAAVLEQRSLDSNSSRVVVGAEAEADAAVTTMTSPDTPSSRAVSRTESPHSGHSSRPVSGTYAHAQDVLQRGSSVLEGDGDGDDDLLHDQSQHHHHHSSNSGAHSEVVAGHHHHHHHHNHHHKDHEHAAAVVALKDVPCYRKPSEGVAKFKELMSHEISSRKYLDGKRRCAKNSRFKLKGLEEGAEREMMDDLDAPLPEDFALKSALVNSLFPRNVNEIPSAHHHLLNRAATTSGGQRPRLTSSSSHKSLGGGGGGGTQVQVSIYSEGDTQLSSWKDFSVSRSVDLMNGAHVTLPILSSYTRVHHQPATTAAETAGNPRKVDSSTLSRPSTYLEIARRTNDSMSKTTERRKLL